MDGASYRQAAARHGVSTSVAWKWSQGFRHIAAKPGGDGRSRLKGARGWLLRRVAATPDLTLGQLQEELRVHGIRVGRMARRRFLKKSIIETGNEQGGWRGGRYAKSLRPCGSERVCALVAVMVVVASPAFAQSVGKAQKQHSLQPSSYGAYGGQKRHTDPDPNVQFEMMRQRNWRKG